MSELFLEFIENHNFEIEEVIYEEFEKQFPEHILYISDAGTVEVFSKNGKRILTTG